MRNTMPDISEQTLIPAPLDVVWPLLSNPATVAACIPGAELAPPSDDGLWRGSIKVRFGPTSAAFRGEAKLDYDHEAHRCRIEGRGIDLRGASRALANGEVLAAAEGNGTRLTVNGSFTVTGPLETFANAGGIHLARTLLAEFTNNMANEAMAVIAAAEMAARPEPPLPRPIQVKEINAFSLIWRSLLSWIGSLFGKGTN
jgi:carbon monoxide dehydrogenase subunit G